MSGYRVRNQVLVAGIEATPGTLEALTVAANAIKVIGLSYSPAFDILDTDDEHTGSLDAGDPIIGGGSIGMGFGVTMRGAGAAGSAPEYDAILRGCGLAATTTAADITGTAQAGAASAITLAAAASAVDDVYIGMVIAIDGGTGSGQSAVITDYVGSTKVATVATAWATAPDVTSTYSIYANVLYRPASVSLENLSLGGYQHSSAGGQSLLRNIAGGAGNMDLEIVNRAIGRMNFQFTGLLPALPANVAHPGAATFDDVAAEAFKNAEALMGGLPVKFNRLSLSLGNEVSQADDPAATFGLDVAAVVARKITGSINPNQTDLATMNNMSDFLNQVERSIVLRWGSTAGKRISLYIPAAKKTGATPTDNSGFAAEEVPFQATGADAGFYLCVH